jgi:hypothetical protein
MSFQAPDTRRCVTWAQGTSYFVGAAPRGLTGSMLNRVGGGLNIAMGPFCRWVT